MSLDNFDKFGPIWTGFDKIEQIKTILNKFMQTNFDEFSRQQLRRKVQADKFGQVWTGLIWFVDDNSVDANAKREIQM